MDAEPARPFLGPLVRRACRNLEARAWAAQGVGGMDLETESALRQLHQAFMYIESLRRQQQPLGGGGADGAVVEEEEEGGGEEGEKEIAPGLSPALQKEFGRLIAAAWAASEAHLLAARVRTSAFQLDVQAAAEGLGLCCLPEARDGPFTLDMVIPANVESSAYTVREGAIG
jgi:hypothetical protein